MQANDLKEWLLNIKESYLVELKTASDLPKSFWETYSSFSNTSGGIVIFGITEGKPQNNIVGVKNVEKITTALWDQLSNKNKVSFKNIDNRDVLVFAIDDKKIIIIKIKEAAEGMKPVYINGRQENTYIRTGEGDRKATQDEINTFLRNAKPIQDEMTAEKYTFDDIDMLSVTSYKEKAHLRHPTYGYDKNNF